MSFLTRTAPRIATYTSLAPRAFSTTFIAFKSATEIVKDAAKTVDRTVSDKLVDGIEAGRKCSMPPLHLLSPWGAISSLMLGLQIWSIRDHQLRFNTSSDHIC